MRDVAVVVVAVIVLVLVACFKYIARAFSYETSVKCHVGSNFYILITF